MAFSKIERIVYFVNVAVAVFLVIVAATAGIVVGPDSAFSYIILYKI